MRSDNEKTLQIIHELTSPVEAIVNLLYLIRHEKGNSKAVVGYLNHADSQVNCLIEIVRRGADVPLVRPN